MKKTTVKIKTIITANAPVEFKKQVGALLNKLMTDYNVTGEKEFVDAFKSTFKSNLYYLIDNYFNLKAGKIERRRQNGEYNKN